jgi:hypothetical protein
MENTPFKKWLLLFMLIIYPFIFIVLVYGGFFGIPHSHCAHVRATN